MVERNSDPIARASILAVQANLAVKRGQLDAAHRQAADAVASVESVRGRAENSRVLAAMMASNQRVYKAYVRVLMAEHEAKPSAGFDRQALEISERARARSLLEMVMDMRPDARARHPRRSTSCAGCRSGSTRRRRPPTPRNARNGPTRPRSRGNCPS